jgi:hypothetical protein
MLTHIKRLLAAAIVLAAVALPVAADARVDQNPISSGPVAVEPPYPAPAPAHATPAVASASGSSFQWGDAGIGAGSLLVLIGVGAGAAVAYRHRTGRPVTG